ncbi:MAG: hypothetical protein LEGION0403_FIIPPAGN_02741 [Legionella sp.]
MSNIETSHVDCLNLLIVIYVSQYKSTKIIVPRAFYMSAYSSNQLVKLIPFEHPETYVFLCSSLIISVFSPITFNLSQRLNIFLASVTFNLIMLSKIQYVLIEITLVISLPSRMEIKEVTWSSKTIQPS